MSKRGPVVIIGKSTLPANYSTLVAVHETRGVLNFAQTFTRAAPLRRHVLRYYPTARIIEESGL